MEPKNEPTTIRPTVLPEDPAYGDQRDAPGRWPIGYEPPTRFQTAAGSDRPEDAPAMEVAPEGHMVGPSLSQARWDLIHAQTLHDLHMEAQAAEEQARYLRREEEQLRSRRVEWEAQAAALRYLVGNLQQAEELAAKAHAASGAEELAAAEEQLERKAGRR